MAPESYPERLPDAKDPAVFSRKMAQFCLEHNHNVLLTARNPPMEARSKSAEAFDKLIPTGRDSTSSA